MGDCWHIYEDREAAPNNVDSLGFKVEGRNHITVRDGRWDPGYQEVGTEVKLWERYLGRFATAAEELSENYYEAIGGRTIKRQRDMRREEFRSAMNAIEILYGETWEGLQKTGTGIWESQRRGESEGWLECQHCGKKEKNGDCLFPWSVLRGVRDGTQSLEEVKSKLDGKAFT